MLQPHIDPARFYVLTVPSGATDRVAEGEFKRWKVGLKPVELPAYLHNKAMVLRIGANEIHFAEFDLWAEPLDQAISRVMKETLNSAQNVESVVLNSHGDDTLDYEVAIRILACEGVRVENGKGSIRFAATWETRSVEKGATVTKCGVFSAEHVSWNGRDYGQLAKLLSEAMADAGKAIVAGLPQENRTVGKSSAVETKP